jgi:hypothetical protein
MESGSDSYITTTKEGFREMVMTTAQALIIASSPLWLGVGVGIGLAVSRGRKWRQER